MRDSARTGSTRVRAADGADVAHLESFIEARKGVEGFVEPRTAVSEVTLLLVAHDGEWTRRRVPNAQSYWARPHSYSVQPSTSPAEPAERCMGLSPLRRTQYRSSL